MAPCLKIPAQFARLFVMLIIGLTACFRLSAGEPVSLQKGSVFIIDQAEFIQSDLTSPPNPSFNWKAVNLTHWWQPEDYEHGRNGWYRFHLNLDALPPENLGIYIRRFNMNAALYLNHTLLVDGGSFDEPISRNWNRPLYARVPPALWHEGQNIIHVRLKSYPQYAYLSPVAIGPANTLSSEYKIQSLLQMDIGAALFPLTLAVALFIFGLWLRRPHDVQYLWFSLAVFAWSAYSLNMFVINLPVSTKAWEWLAHSCVDWWVILFSIFANRLTNHPRPLLERVYLTFGIVACLVYALIDFETMKTATRWFHGLAIVIGFITTSFIFIAGYKHNNKVCKILAWGLVLLLMTGVHDWMFQTSIIGVTGPLSLHLHHYTAPLIFLFMAWHLSGRFITALNESEKLNIELEDRVEQARKQIELDYLTITQMSQAQAVLQERERLSREIHDGLSGNISNSIMMTELMESQFSNEKSANGIIHRLQNLRSYLHDGLSEMRSLILTMENDVATLDDLSSHIGDSYERVLSGAQIELNLQRQFEHPQLHLQQKQSLNILRITQEVLNNIIKHAKADHVDIEITESTGQLDLMIRDNGIGFDPGLDKKGSYGLANLDKRSREIDGQIKIESSPGRGTTIYFSMKLTD